MSSTRLFFCEWTKKMYCKFTKVYASRLNTFARYDTITAPHPLTLLFRHSTIHRKMKKKMHKKILNDNHSK